MKNANLKRINRMTLRAVPEQSRIYIADRVQQFRDSSDPVLTFEKDLSNPERALVHELSRKMGFKSKSSGGGKMRCVSVYKTGVSQKAKKKKKAKKAIGVSQEAKPHETSLSFSIETQAVLNELFSRYPPTEKEFAGKVEVGPAALKMSSKTDKILEGFSKPSMSQFEIAKQVEMLASRLRKTPGLQQIAKDRSKLPIASFKDRIVSTVESNQVVLIAGETGCGKTTQIPQFILDHMWSQGNACKILCTQPRRVSAISVAERIAAERGEKIGVTVGYQIRLESKGGKHSSLMFCTNGVLLRKLVDLGSQHFEPASGHKRQNMYRSHGLDATHIIVDEIHERDRYCDFMLVILRDLLRLQPNLHLILMSATLEAEKFSKYFNKCPVICIPGFTYPVCSYYLEDVLSLVEFKKNRNVANKVSSKSLDSEVTENSSSLAEEDRNAMDEAISLAWLEDDFDLLMDIIAGNPIPEVCNYQHSLTRVSALMVAAGKGRVDDVSLLLSFGADCSLRAQDGSTALEWARRADKKEAVELVLKLIEDKAQKQSHIEKSQLLSSPEEAELLNEYLATVNVETVDVALIENLLGKICMNPTMTDSESENGAILIFFPGWEEISLCKERLQQSSIFSDSSKYLILPLHSMVPSAEQKKVFRRPPHGVRKIVLSTNIAETAVTIDDIFYVIDSGRMKEKSYDPYTNVSILQTTWISKASAKQRAGRAGRCQPGICYHLFSKVRFAALPDYQVPEIKRTPLEELCLQVKLQNPYCNISDFISKAIDPPVDMAVRNAITVLQDIGALTHDEKLTELGKQLGSLPVHPSTSKMLLFSILMNCLDPALTIACVAGYREPFVLPMAPQEKKRAFAAKMQLTELYGGFSDHLAVLAAFEGWRQARINGQAADFCRKYYVSHSIMLMLDGMRNQLRRELSKRGFVPEDLNSCSLNANDPGILRAVLVAGLYPMVGTLLPPLSNGQKAVVQTAKGEKVRIHPQSANTITANSSKKTLLAFDEITRGESRVFIRNCTLFKPYPLFLLATEMVVAPLDPDEDEDEGDEIIDTEDEDECLKSLSAENYHEKIMSSPDKTVLVVVDRWLRFEATSLDAAQIYCLRERLSAALTFKVKHPRETLPPILGESVFAIACLLSYEGLLDEELLTNWNDQQGFYSSHGNEQRIPAYIIDHRGNAHTTRLGPDINPGNRPPQGIDCGLQPQGIECGLQQNRSPRNVRQLYVPVRDGRMTNGSNRMEEHLQEIPVLYNDMTSKRARGSG